MGKRAVKTGRIFGLGCLFLQATGRPAGPYGPHTSRRRGQEYTQHSALIESLFCAECYARRALGPSRLTFMEHIFWRRRVFDK